MSDVQQVKASVCRHKFFPGSLQLLAAFRKFFERDDFSAHTFPIRRELCVKRTKRRGKVPKGSGWNCRELNFLAAKSVVGLYPRFEPRCGKMKASETFHISRKLVV